MYFTGDPPHTDWQCIQCHFAVKREMRLSEGACFQCFAAPHVHFFLIPTRQTDLISKHFCLDDLIPFDMI